MATKDKLSLIDTELESIESEIESTQRVLLRIINAVTSVRKTVMKMRREASINYVPESKGVSYTVLPERLCEFCEVPLEGTPEVFGDERLCVICNSPESVYLRTQAKGRNDN